MATKLQDTDLLSRISGGDVIAVEAKYHSTYMLGCKNRFRSFERKTIETPIASSTSRVLAELV